MKIYTRKGDDGTTGLLYGGRVSKGSEWPEAYGTVDEAQAAIGVARAHADGELAAILLGTERDLWVLMAELATDPQRRDKLVDGQTRATGDMVSALETIIDDVSDRFDPPTEFVVPGESITAAHLDVARTVVRRAERATIVATDAAGSGGAGDESHAVAYLNRLSDLLWTLARWQEGGSRPAKGVD